MHASVKLHAMTGGNSADGPSVAIGELPIKGGTAQSATPGNRYQVAATSFVVLFWIVGVSLWGCISFTISWFRIRLDTSASNLGQRAQQLGILMAASALMGLGYLGIGIGGATVPWISNALVHHFGWQAELRILGLSLAVLSFGGDYVVISLMAAENFGIEILGWLLGVIIISARLAGAAAPWAVGRLRDVTGTYTAARFALIGVALLGGLAALSLPDRRRVE